MEKWTASIMACGLVLAGGAAQAYQSLPNPDEYLSRPKSGSEYRISDYPMTALRADEEGAVVFQYEVNEQGDVTPGSCEVVESSGSGSLDHAACRIAESRFRFYPAVKDGKPVRETRMQRVVWSLPGGSGKGSAMSARTAMWMARSALRCIAAKQGDMTERALALPVGGQEQLDALRKVSNSKHGCWQPTIQYNIPPLLLAGGLADAFLPRTAPELEPVALSAASAAFEPRNEIETIAHCVLRRNPIAAKRLALAESDAAEGAAIKDLVPDLGPCVSAGSKLTMNKMSLRSMLSLAIYQSLPKQSPPAH